jgi:hypothetical protein
LVRKETIIMTSSSVGHTPTPEVPTTAAGKLIDFRQEARRRAIVAELASGRFCAFCLLRRLIERYPLFFELPERAVFSSPVSNDADAPQEGQP